jgi:hypothetical protein
MSWSIFVIYATAFGVMGYIISSWSYKRGMQTERMDAVTFLQQLGQTAVVQQQCCALPDTAKSWRSKEATYAHIERCLTRGWHEGEALRRAKEERRMTLPARRRR